ncbi:ACP S-malonyltransferase, partial [Candidatus Pelagibacter sp.]|nr:ACP S-malonyltransferase [Candidatus Pelagibacter sp.]
SQNVGMAKEFYENFDYVRNYFSIADELLGKNLSKIILEGPKEDLDLTENTQPAVFLVSYSIFKVLQNETDFEIKKAKFYAGHSLGEYSALCCADSINFEQTIKLLDSRGKAMQNATSKGVGGMFAILGTDIEKINNILKDKNKFQCYIANDNSVGQIVVSGKMNSLNILGEELNEKKIKFIKLPVSAPFHCPLMNSATIEMQQKLLNTNFKDPVIDIISNVNASPQNKSEEIKKLLIEQIEKPVRWRESVINMIDLGVSKFVEIGPGKVLSGLIKRIDRNVKLNHINNLTDIKSIKND